MFKIIEAVKNVAVASVALTGTVWLALAIIPSL